MNRAGCQACQDCPQGSFCEGQLRLPYPQVNYYAPTNPTEGDGSQQVVLGYPFEASEYMRGASLDGEEDWALPQIFFPCRSEGFCLGGRDFACEPKRDGALCNRCRDGYFDIGGFCLECGDGSLKWVYTFLGIFAVVLLWVALNLATSTYDLADIGLHYLQNVAIIQGYNTIWPDALKNVCVPRWAPQRGARACPARFPWHPLDPDPLPLLLGQVSLVFSIVNFDVDFVAPSCIMAWSTTRAIYTQVGPSPLPTGAPGVPPPPS